MTRLADRTTRFCLRLGLAGAVGWLAGCGSLPPAEGALRPWEVAELEHQIRRLEASSRRVDDPALMRRIEQWLGRIDPIAAAPIRVFLLDGPRPQADLVGGRLLRIRTGLLRQLRHEDELVFVLAHELAHRRLDHVRARRDPGWDQGLAEIEADRIAHADLIRLERDPGAGFALIARLRPHATTAAEREQARARMDALAALGAPAGRPSRRDSDAAFEALLAPYR
jgi:hypothetical protein